MKRPAVAIIGAGASGLCAAIEAAVTAKGKADIVVFESLARCGKKILATGNGRCNLSNADTDLSHYYGDASLVSSVFESYSPQSTLDFFQTLGLFLRVDQAGRIYPLSNQASAVLDSLRFEVQRLQVEIKTETPVKTIEKTKDGYLLNGSFFADSVVIACGGKAAPVHGSDGSGYALLHSLQVKTTPVFPALTPLIIDQFPKSLKGIRAEGSIAVKNRGKILAQSTGEIQYTDYGLSGIPAMQVSGAVSGLLTEDPNAVCHVFIDRAPGVSEAQLTDYIMRQKKERPALLCEDLLTGIMPKRLGVTVLTEVSVQPQKNLNALNAGAVSALVANIKSKKYKVSSVCGFAEAQVTGGGVPVSEINMQTLALNKAAHIHVCGEIVNVHGDCGGYNLLWAWNSGRLAGYSAVKGCLC